MCCFLFTKINIVCFHWISRVLAIPILIFEALCLSHHLKLLNQKYFDESLSPFPSVSRYKRTLTPTHEWTDSEDKRSELLFLDSEGQLVEAVDITGLTRKEMRAAMAERGFTEMVREFHEEL